MISIIYDSFPSSLQRIYFDKNKILIKRIISCCFPKLSTTALCLIGLSWWRHRKWGNTYKKRQFQNPVWKLFSLNSDSDWSELTEQQQTLQWKTKKRTLIFFLEVIFFLSYLKISKKYFSCIHRIRSLFHLDLRVEFCHQPPGTERFGTASNLFWPVTF